MPVTITKINGKYRVSTPYGVKSKGTTLAKAIRQRNLLNAIEHSSWRPTQSAKKRKKKLRKLALERSKV